MRAVRRDEGPGRSSDLHYDGPHCIGWSTINCGPDTVIARVVVESDAWLRAKAFYLHPSDPDWIVQEAVFRAIERATRLRPNASPLRFLERIMVFVALELRRHRRGASLTDVAERDIPTVDSTPLELAEEVQESQRLARRILDELPVVEREAVWLIDVERLTLSEAACLSGRTKDALRMARRRGRDRLGLDDRCSSRRSTGI